MKEIAIEGGRLNMSNQLTCMVGDSFSHYKLRGRLGRWFWRVFGIRQIFNEGYLAGWKAALIVESQKSSIVDKEKIHIAEELKTMPIQSIAMPCCDVNFNVGINGAQEFDFNKGY